MKNTNKYQVSILTATLMSFAMLGAPPAHTATFVEIPAASPDIHWSHGSAVIADHEAGTASAIRNLFSPAGLPDPAEVNAMHGLSNGEILFSLEVSLELDGTLYRPNDIVRFNGSSWSKELDGLVAGIPMGANIDAVAKSGEFLLFSLDIGVEFASMTVSDADILAFDGEAFSLFMSASELGIEASADLDALHMDEQGRILISLDNSGQLGGVHYRDEDLLAREFGSWSIEIDNNKPAWIAADLDAWTIVFMNNIIFANGFE
jgi:hypothetical protein